MLHFKCSRSARSARSGRGPRLWVPHRMATSAVSARSASRPRPRTAETAMASEVLARSGSDGRTFGNSWGIGALWRYIYIVKVNWQSEESVKKIVNKALIKYWSTFWDILVSVLWVSFSDLFRWQNPWDSVPFSDSVPACSGSGVLHLRQPDSCELSTPLERRSSSWQPGYRNVQKAPHSCRKILGKMVLVCTGDKHIWKTCGDPYISCNLIWSHDVV